MIVHKYGFKLKLAKNLSVAEFFQELERFDDKEVTIQSRVRVPYFDVKDNYIVGCVLTYKTNKKSLVSERDGAGDLIVKKSELGEGEHGTEVSMVCINPSNLHGLFYSYTGALSHMALHELLKKAHTSLKKQRKKDFKNQLTQLSDKPVANLAQKLEEEYSGDLEFTALSTQSDLNSMLDEFSEIQELVVRSEDILSAAGTYSPLDPFARSATISVSIEKDPTFSIKNLLTAIKGSFSHYNNYGAADRFMIRGIALNGEEIRRVVGENANEFGSESFDDFVSKLPVSKWKLYKNSTALKDLMDTIKAKTVIFGTKPKKPWKLQSAKDIKQ